ncbi:MAG: Fic family protein [Phycisphaerales bacterium]
MRQDLPPYTFRTCLQGPGGAVLPLDPRLSELLADRYDPWRIFRHIARDRGLDPALAWAAAKARRLSTFRDLPLEQTDGRRFGVNEWPGLSAILHRIDRSSGGDAPAVLGERGVLGDADSRTRFRIKTLMEEAAESSIIEGASKTRAQAVELLRQGRSPADRGERMIVNNYLAMDLIKRRLREPLTPGLLLELQETLTAGTLSNPGAVGRFRLPEERVDVVDVRTDEVIFVPPPAAELPARLDALCRFANAPHQNAEFIHPIVKASILHFMVGYEHPFVDGNGRTARAIFYWYALRSGYTLFEFLAISEIIRKGFARYPAAYLDTETDEGDLTYFVLYKLDVIAQSLDTLAERIRHESDKITRSEALLRLASDLNLRQRLLLEHALRKPGTRYTVKSHMHSNGISQNAARSDLERLVARRLMTSAREGRAAVYRVIPNLRERLERVLRKRG